MNKLFVALVVAIVGWLGLALPSGPALAAPAPSIQTYAYDVHQSASNTITVALDRGPPESHCYTSFDGDGDGDGDGCWSRGASARVNVTARLSVSTDDRAARPVRIDSASGRRASSVGVTGGDPSAFAAAGVAAKTETSLGSRLAENCMNSFTGSTLVLMADGTKRPIKEVELGGWVMAKDPATGEQRREQVIRLIRHSGPHTMVAVRLADGSTIDATDHHPFWVASRGAWVDAIELVAGDIVETADGKQIAVASVGIRAEDLTAYNLTVENAHTYFAGDDAVLVHNAGCDPSDLRGLSDSYVKRLLKQYDTEPHAFKEEFVGRGAVPKFDIKMGPDGELHLVNKDGSVVIPTGVFPER